MAARFSMLIQWSDEDDAYIVTVPELPGCLTHGATYADAVRQGEDAIATWLETARAWGDPIPPPRVLGVALGGNWLTYSAGITRSPTRLPADGSDSSGGRLPEGGSMFTITRLNHMVLYVRDVERSTAFYRDVLGFSVTTEHPGRAAFLRASGSDNHHDLGLFGIGPDAPGPTKGDRVGLYHGAWEVPSIEDLIRARDALTAAGALVGDNDHGASLSLYAVDPDGNEFEVFWPVPREEWDTRKGGRLDLEAELAARS